MGRGLCCDFPALCFSTSAQLLLRLLKERLCPRLSVSLAKETRPVTAASSVSRRRALGRASGFRFKSNAKSCDAAFSAQFLQTSSAPPPEDGSGKGPRSGNSARPLSLLSQSLGCALDHQSLPGISANPHCSWQRLGLCAALSGRLPSFPFQTNASLEPLGVERRPFAAVYRQRTRGARFKHPFFFVSDAASDFLCGGRGGGRQRRSRTEKRRRESRRPP